MSEGLGLPLIYVRNDTFTLKLFLAYISFLSLEKYVMYLKHNFKNEKAYKG